MSRLANKRLTIRISTEESGFTIIEVMVAALILVIGILATVKLVDGANAATVLTRGRVAGLSLTRDVIEAARGIDYSNLSCATASGCTTSDLAVTALENQPGLSSSSPTTWVVSRGNTNMTITLKVCKVDETADGLGNNDGADPAFCSTYPCPTAAFTNCTDKNPDDYRKVDVTVTWTPGSGIVGKKSVRQIGIISNPAGGLGPSFSRGPCVLSAAATSATTACPATQILMLRGVNRPACDGTHSTPPSAAACIGPPDPSCSGASCIPVWAQTNSSDTGAVHWSTDDALSSHGDGTALSGTTKWGISWPIGALNTSVINPFTTAPAICTANQHPPIFDLAAAQNVVLDGNYTMSVQGFDSLGVPGLLKTIPITLNRYPPAIPCPPQGGYNVPAASTGNSPVVDFEWVPNVERDIRGYKVYWANIDGILGNGNDVAVCGSSSPVTDTFCRDNNPSAHGLSNVGDTAVYYVTAVDNFDSESNASLPIVVTILPTNTPPRKPLSPSGGSVPDYAVVNGQPTVTWSTDPTQYTGGTLDPDVGDSVIGYRVYRDGVALSNRIAKVGAAGPGVTTASYTDTTAVGSHSYYVTAIDSHYQESAPAGPTP